LLGVEYVSAMLKQAGHQVVLVHDPRLFQDSFQMNAPLARMFALDRRTVDEAAATNADVYALSVSSPDWGWARAMTTALKARTGKPIIVGGVHCSASTESVARHPAIDYVVTGEAEDAIVDLIAALESGRDPAALQNVSMVRDGTFIGNPNRPLVVDLDRLPFSDKSIFYDISGHFRHGYNIMASRGCPKACSYCLNSWYRFKFPNEHDWWRVRSVENVIDELEQAKALYKPNHFRFVDDEFAYDRQWFLKFVPEYKKRIGVPYRIFLDADNCDEELVRLLDESGCFEAEVGVQTISRELRSKVFQRSQIPGKVVETIDLFAKTRTTLVMDNILGYPDQTPEDLAELIEFYRDHRPSRVQNLWLRFWPGTPIIEITREKGYFTAEQAKALNEEPANRACVIGDEVKRPWERRASALIYAAFFVPKWFTTFWVTNLRFVRFPALPEWLAYMLTNLGNTQISMYGRRFAHRYMKYSLYRLAGPFRKLVDRVFFGGRSPLAGRYSTRVDITPRASARPLAPPPEPLPASSAASDAG
jgi:hypothetical protein